MNQRIGHIRVMYSMAIVIVVLSCVGSALIGLMRAESSFSEFEDKLLLPGLGYRSCVGDLCIFIVVRFKGSGSLWSRKQHPTS